VASGPVALDEAAARAAAQAGTPAILVRAQAETADIAALDQAAGLLTQRGARTSHAAVVARQMGKVCVVGCEDLRIDLAARTVRIAGRTFGEQDILTLDGNTGALHAGAVRTVRVEPQELLRRLAKLRAQPTPHAPREHHRPPGVPARPLSSAPSSGRRRVKAIAEHSASSATTSKAGGKSAG
jgi:pyruvate, orthophosphate dikinase